MTTQIFEMVAAELAKRAGCAPVEARSILTAAMDQVGLDARTVTPDEMTVVLRDTLPSELRQSAVDASGQICEHLLRAAKSFPAKQVQEPKTPEDLFLRIRKRH